ncbi:MAG: HAMP domain-containing protein, partial [Curvibacter sp.]
MEQLRQLRIGVRLTVAFAVVLLLLAGLGGFGMYQTSRANAYARDLGNNWLPSVKVLGDMRASLNRARRASLQALLESNPEARVVHQKKHQEETEQVLPKLIAIYEPMIASAEERSAYEKFRSSLEQLLALKKRQMQLAMGSDSDVEAGRKLALGDAAKAFAEVASASQKDIDINVTGAENSTLASERSYQQALTVFGGVIAVALLTGAVLAVVVTRSITHPLVISVAVAEAVAEGDLTTQFDIQGRDEPADLLRALQHMNERLVDIVGQVRLSSDSIATGSAEIAT